MRILLVNPPTPLPYYNSREYYIPSSLLYLAAVLQNNGEEIKILDMKTFKFEELENPKKFYTFYENLLINTISDFNPELIGFGCLFSGHFPDILKFSILIKEKYKHIPVVIGGIHPTIYPFEILSNCPSIDWLVLGEAEQSILQLVNTLKDKSYEFEKIDGFAFRKNGKVIVNPKTHFIKNLDTIPFPAYDIIDLKDYYVDTSNWHNPKKLSINTSIPIISSRSCPNHCNFCSMFMVMGPRWRARSPKNVVDEIEYLYNKYDHRHFSFMDDNFTLKKSHVIEICNQIIKRKLNIQFETPNGIATGTMDEEILDIMVSAGLVRISLAIESGSDFIRNKVMKKHLNKEKIYEVVNLTKKYKQLYVRAFFIIGMPEETEETLMDTYNMIREIDVDRIYLQNIIPYPGTELFNQALKDNLFVGIDPNDFYKSDALYMINYRQFFIKPYKLEIKYLQEFRIKCDNLIAEQKAKKAISVNM
ncbi:MAG: radical SAM protein [Elusimicrobia bacterium]|nr:radical SAM protein [Elusimicrobiota bacterium]